MSLLYKEEDQRTYTIDFKNDGKQIVINVEGNIGKFGVDEPLFSWEGSVNEFVELLAKDNK